MKMGYWHGDQVSKEPERHSQCFNLCVQPPRISNSAGRVNRYVALTFLHVLRPPNSFPDLVFVLEMGLIRESPVESVAKPLVTQGVFSAHVEEFCEH